MKIVKDYLNFLFILIIILTFISIFVDCATTQYKKHESAKVIRAGGMNR